MYNEKGVYLPGDGVQVDMFDCIKANVFNIVTIDDDLDCSNIMESIFEWIAKLKIRMKDLDQENDELRRRSSFLDKEKQRLEGMVYALEKQVKEKETKNSTKTEDPW